MFSGILLEISVRILSNPLWTESWKLLSPPRHLWVYLPKSAHHWFSLIALIISVLFYGLPRFALLFNWSIQPWAARPRRAGNERIPFAFFFLHRALRKPNRFVLSVCFGGNLWTLSVFGFSVGEGRLRLLLCIINWIWFLGSKFQSTAVLGKQQLCFGLVLLTFH